MLSDSERAVTLPKSWQSVAHLRAQVRSPNLVYEFSSASRSPEEAVESPLAALIVLHHLLQPSAPRRRFRTDSTQQCPQATREGKEGQLSRKNGTASQPEKRPTSAICSAVLRRAAQSAMETVLRFMGSADTIVNEAAVLMLYVQLKPTVLATHRKETSSQANQHRLWHITGVCVGEEIAAAYRAVHTTVTLTRPLLRDASPCCCAASYPTLGISDPLQQSEAAPSKSVEHGEPANGAFCGIRLIWVAAEARGRGVAYRMVEAARCVVRPGYQFPNDRVAFSEPTSAGIRFAQRYQQRGDYLLYEV